MKKKFNVFFLAFAFVLACLKGFAVGVDCWQEVNTTSGATTSKMATELGSDVNIIEVSTERMVMNYGWKSNFDALGFSSGFWVPGNITPGGDTGGSSGYKYIMGNAGNAYRHTYCIKTSGDSSGGSGGGETLAAAVNYIIKAN